MPLNVEYPAARHAGILTMAGADLLAYTDGDADLAADVSARTGIRLLRAPDGPPGRPASAGAPPHRAGLDDFAYIVFTSGSTGVPKGVPIRHRNVHGWLSYVVGYFETGPDVRISQTSSLSWDLSVFNVFGAWGAGGAVVVPDATDLLAPSRHIDADQITHWFSTPSSINMARWLGDLTPGSMPTLRWSLFGGEPLTIEHALAWRDAAPNSVIANVYGPTEITVSCLTYRLPADPARWPRVAFGSLPLGFAYPTVECAVVPSPGDPPGEGELLVRGPQRFDGYLDPAHNEGRFAYWDGRELRPHHGGQLTDDVWFRTGDRVRVEDGRYAFLGRMDNQVKVNGYRIEL
ncbi:MAG: AMP-binding protein, partial [Actinomycetes bacterium]